LVMRVGILDVRAEGTVRVVHPETGMGVEFVQKTEEEQAKVTVFLDALRSDTSRAPQSLVEPEEMDLEAAPVTDAARIDEDPLLALFVRRDELSQEAFLSELLSQRGGIPASSISVTASAVLR
jgi:hypothetical protein